MRSSCYHGHRASRGMTVPLFRNLFMALLSTLVLEISRQTIHKKTPTKNKILTFFCLPIYNKKKQLLTIFVSPILV